MNPLSAQKIKSLIHPIDFYICELGISPSSSDVNWFVAGLCPFHPDTKQGSFRVNYQTGAFTCFSCRAKGGDIIAFTESKYGLSFKEAMSKLSKEWRG